LAGPNCKGRFSEVFRRDRSEGPPQWITRQDREGSCNATPLKGTTALRDVQRTPDCGGIADL